VFHRYGVFKVRAGRRPPNETAVDGLSKLNSVLRAEVDVILGEPEHRTAALLKSNTAIDESSAHRSKSSGIP
jgi:hypothetical protein